MSQFSIIKSPVNQYGFQIGQKVRFTEHAYPHPQAPVTLRGTGTVIGWSRHPSGQIVVAPETVETDATRGGAFKGFYAGQDARPFKASELAPLAVASPTGRLSFPTIGRKPDLFIADDIGADARTKAKPFKVGDLIERTGRSASSYGEQGKQYTVLAVSAYGNPVVKEGAGPGNKDSYKLIKTREQIAFEKVIYSFASLTSVNPVAGRTVTPTQAPAVPNATANKPMKYRVLSADGATASSRTWDTYEAALKDAEARAGKDENYREFQVVAVVATAKAEKLKIVKYQRGGVVVNRS